jgi:hypothetical protein
MLRGFVRYMSDTSPLHDRLQSGHISLKKPLEYPYGKLQRYRQLVRGRKFCLREWDNYGLFSCIYLYALLELHGFNPAKTTSITSWITNFYDRQLRLLYINALSLHVFIKTAGSFHKNI